MRRPGAVSPPAGRPVHLTGWSDDNEMGRPALAAVLNTSMPTASIDGRASYGRRQDLPLATPTHSGTQQADAPAEAGCVVIAGLERLRFQLGDDAAQQQVRLAMQQGLELGHVLPRQTLARPDRLSSVRTRPAPAAPRRTARACRGTRPPTWCWVGSAGSSRSPDTPARRTSSARARRPPPVPPASGRRA